MLPRPFLRPCVHAHPYALKRCSGFYFLAFFRRHRRVVANRVRRGAETEKVINVRGGETHLLPQGAAGEGWGDRARGGHGAALGRGRIGQRNWTRFRMAESRPLPVRVVPVFLVSGF